MAFEQQRFEGGDSNLLRADHGLLIMDGFEMAGIEFNQCCGIEPGIHRYTVAQ